MASPALAQPRNDDALTLQVPVTVLPHGKHLDLPAYATQHAAGLDLLAAIDTPMTLKPMERALVPTGLSFALPPGFEAQVRPRSGLALKHGLTCLNTPGTIDADYRGEVKVLLINLGQETYTIEPGTRIAQMVVARHETIEWKPVEELPESGRGAGGFGSTGTR